MPAWRGGADEKDTARGSETEARDVVRESAKGERIERREIKGDTKKEK